MWQTYSIPESVARKHFGLTLHAELYTTAPFSAGSLGDILDIADSRIAAEDEYFPKDE